MADVHHAGFGFVEFQSFGREPLFGSVQHPLSLPGAARDDEVIGTTHHPCLACAPLVHPVIQRIEVEIGQERRNHPALRRAAKVGRNAPFPVSVFLHDGRAQPTFDQPQDAAITHPPGHLFEQLPMGNRVEVTAQVRVDDLDVTLLRRAVNLVDRLVRPPLGPKSK